MLIPAAISFLLLSAPEAPPRAAPTSDPTPAPERTASGALDGAAPDGLSGPMRGFSAKGGAKKSWILKRPAMPQGSVFGIGAQVGYPLRSR